MSVRMHSGIEGSANEHQVNGMAVTNSRGRGLVGRLGWPVGDGNGDKHS